MDLHTLVAENSIWFRGVASETSDTIAEAEGRLGVCLPQSLKWLLTEHGYSSACGVASLGEAVAMTLACRRSIGLSPRYMILEDKGDAGVVLLDTESEGGRVLWIGSHEIRRLSAGERVNDFDEYAEFAAWVLRCLEEAKEESES
jgi:hypothetical protein